MILRRLQVQHLRCVRNLISVGPFGDGINLLYGPNESGKSTLLEAAALALLDKHSTTGKDIDSFVPWGTSLSPEIVLEVESDGTCYRLTKTFLAGCRSLLSEQTAGIYQDRAQGDAADGMVRELLLGELPGRGRTRPEQWGVLRLLWSLQAPNGQNDRLVSEPVADRLREAVGGVQIRTYLGDLLRRVNNAHDEIFTPQRGDFQKNSTVQALRQEIDDLTKRRDEALRAVEEARGWADQLQARRAELARLDDERVQTQAKVEVHRTAATALVQTRERVKLAEAEEAAQGKELEAAQRRLDDYRKQMRLYETNREQWRKLSSEQKGEQDELAVLEEQVQRLRAEVQTQDERLATLRGKLRQAQQAEKAQALEEQLGVLNAQVKDLDKLAAQVAKAEQELAGTPVPTRAEMKRATEAEGACQRLRAQLEALGLRVSVVAQKKQTVIFGSEERREEVPLAAHAQAEFTSATAASLELPGVAQIEIRSGAGEVAEAKVELEKTESALHDLLSRFGVKAAAELAVLQERDKARRHDLERLQEQLTERADPFDDVSEVRQRLGQVKNQLAALGPAEAPGEGSEALAAQIEAAEKDMRFLRRRLQDAEKKRDDARTKLSDAERELALCALRRETAQQSAHHLLGDAGDEQALATRVESLQAKHEQARLEAEALRGQLPAPESDPEALLKADQDSLEDLARNEREVRDKIAILGANIQAAETQGRFEQLSIAEEELESRRRRLERELTRAVGLRLLRSILRTRRQGSRSEGLHGLEERISRILSAVTARTERHVRVEPDFSVPGFSPDPSNGPLREINVLSAGTQEQLWMSVRIALGETYAEKHGRQAMVLDDMLVYTDPDRHDRMLQVLRRAADKLQIFIVTSRPALYRGLTEPECQFDIGAL